MKLKYTIILLGMLWLCLSQACYTPADNRADKQIEESDSVYQATSRIFVDETQQVTQIENSFFIQHTIPSDHTEAHIYFNVTEKQRFDTNNARQATQYLFKPVPLLHSIHTTYDSLLVSGHHYELNKNILSIEQQGDEYGENVYQLYNIVSGNHLIDYTYSKMEIISSNTSNKRFVGFLSRAASLDHPELFSEDKTIGYIIYASDEEKKTTIKLNAAASDISKSIHPTTPDMLLRDINRSSISLNGGKSLYVSNPIQDASFFIEYTFYYGSQYASANLSLLVEYDSIDVNRIRFDRNLFEIEVVQH